MLLSMKQIVVWFYGSVMSRLNSRFWGRMYTIESKSFTQYVAKQAPFSVNFVISSRSAKEEHQPTLHDLI